MPTEQEIESACVAFVAQSNEDSGDNATWPDDFDQSGREAIRRVTRAALTAAEEVRGRVSEEDASVRDAAENMLIAFGMGWDLDDTAEVLRAALARRGAGQAVPDGWVLVPKEPNIAMIQAMALAAEEQLRLTSPTEGRMKVNFSHVSVFRAAIAAAPKPEDKP